VEGLLAHQVFVTHAREDLDVALRVCAILEADGIICWLGSRDAPATKNKAASNLEAIRTSDLVLLIFSAAANASPYVLRDIERAIAYERPVLSIHLDDANPNASLEYYLNLWQWLDASGAIEDRRGEIVAAVRGQLGFAARTRLVLPEAASPVSNAAQELGPSSDESGEPRGRPLWTLVVALVSLVVVAALGLGLGFGLTQSQDTWTELFPQGPLPAGRDAPSMVLDPRDATLVMFGGVNTTGPLDDSWTYDPKANIWTDLKPSGPVPAARWGHALAFDAATRRVILFGGYDGTTYHNDTWAYDPGANTWTDLKPSGSVPDARAGCRMVYDPSARRLILFGGGSGGEYEREPLTTTFDDTWSYDAAANTWTKLMPAGQSPPAREAHAMAYDPSIQKVVLFGGRNYDADVDYNDTWAFDPSSDSWMELKPSSALPPERCSFSMTYDPSSDRLVLFGGLHRAAASQHLSDIWGYDAVANTWTELPTKGPGPAAREYPALVYCPSIDRVVMFGGASPRASLNDTWILEQ
jgi:hypothetical protein